MKQLLAFAILLLLSAQTFAQKHQHHEDPVLSHSKELNLSSVQTAKITAMQKEHRLAMQSLMKSDTLTAMARRQRMHELRDQYRKEVNSVLTPEQVATLGTFRRDSTGYKRKGMENKNLKEALHLTEEQTRKMKELQEKNHAEMQRIQQDTAVTEANKKFRIEELKKERRHELESLLTPDQQRKYKEMQTRKRNKDFKQ